MSDPNFHPKLNTGNTSDDDAQIIDSDFLEVDAPPTPVVQPLPPSAPPERRVPTRLIADTLLVNPAWVGTIQLLPADVTRVDLTLVVYTTEAGASLKIIGDSSGATVTPNSSNVVVPLGEYTGPVYVQAAGTLPITVSYLSTVDYQNAKGLNRDA